MTTVFEIIFWAAAVLVLHSYLAYPLTLALAALVVRPPRTTAPGDGDLPSVAVLISVYNEEEIIRERVENLLRQDYPAGKLRVLVGSDGSSDGTNAILAELASPAVRIFPFPQRRGKASVLNDLVAAAGEEVLVFSDANTMFDRDAVRHLVHPLARPDVGGVCGLLILESPARSAGSRGEGSYWNYENMIKALEGRVGTAVGATGAVYAMRRSLVRRLPTDRAIMDDFLIPLGGVEAGYRIVYAPAAVAREEMSGSAAGEYRRKVRIGAANFNGIREIAPLLSPLRGFPAYALWSHKLLRWFAPFLFLAMLLAAAALALDSLFYAAIFAAGCLFLAAALAGWLADRAGVRLSWLSLPYYFVLVNAALVMGFVRFLRGSQKAAWEVIR